MANISKTLDEMIAWNLDAHVMGRSLYHLIVDFLRLNDSSCRWIRLSHVKLYARICSETRRWS